MMNTSDYMKEANRQLMDTHCTKKLESDPTQDYYKELNKLVSCLPEESIRADDLIPGSPRTETFDMLRKIHKSGNPERPIISCVGTLTEPVSGWVEGILKPLVKDTPSFIQDTTNLLNKLSAKGPLPEGTILVTMDVESLYSNISHQDGLNACKFFLENTGTDADSVLKLIKLILTHNYFEFDNKIYLQKTGTAMGSKMATQYANLFMAKLESDFLSSCPIRPLAYYCYIDDILIIWMESERQLKTFHEQFNQFHHTINLTLNYSCTENNFLDTIIKLQNNEIETSLYQKPIDRPTYLKWDSFHPKHIKNSIVYSQAIRYNRICSNHMDRDEHLGRLRLGSHCVSATRLALALAGCTNAMFLMGPRPGVAVTSPLSQIPDLRERGTDRGRASDAASSVRGAPGNTGASLAHAEHGTR
ncbi:unnamed protein product [Ranitomeya imitator]|uniref:Reverse transcriptase domain-containing protein n=1 Tax=Ranitomeya imitator TaxID=111125 RepID=A0ABN9LSV6_9NEOB|nr:unnamed protein product [Ranitomeya imitator]